MPSLLLNLGWTFIFGWTNISKGCGSLSTLHFMTENLKNHYFQKLFSSQWSLGALGSTLNGSTITGAFERNTILFKVLRFQPLLNSKTNKNIYLKTERWWFSFFWELCFLGFSNSHLILETKKLPVKSWHWRITPYVYLHICHHNNTFKKKLENVFSFKKVYICTYRYVEITVV